MKFIYIRHGEPLYDPDSLTELGKKQAEEVAEYLAIKGVDQIFSSTSNRAIQTALPTANRLNKDITHLDFANEKHVWNNLTLSTPTGKVWLFQSKKIIDLFYTREITNLGMNWYEHPEFSNLSFKSEIVKLQNESNHFFKSLGYEYLGNGKYKVLKDNFDRVVMFAHQGFGYAFLSLLLNIPYPYFCTRFELGHAEITLIDFKNEEGYSYPKVVSLSNKINF
ncbi:MAG: histidine phosphatase family protein [Candidatus Izemoplasmatales bacterium]